MMSREKALAVGHAKRWAEEEHAKILAAMPRALRQSIDWEILARNLAISWPESEGPGIVEHMQRVIDYLFLDEESGHITESIVAVQRWLWAFR